MGMFYYKTEQFLPIPIEKAWDFFSSAKNLAVITPPALNFNILTAVDGKEIAEGMLIDYTLRPLFGVPVKWKTEISKVDKPLMFTVRQLKGTYKTWEHTHTFSQKDNGVLMTDELKYKLPFGFIGKIMHSLIVRKKIKDIFNYRRQILHKLFVNHEYNN